MGWLKQRLVRRRQIILGLFQEKGREMYGLQISDITGISLGQIYPTLYRLEQEGILKSRWGVERLPERGGLRRRYYSLNLKEAPMSCKYPGEAIGCKVCDKPATAILIDEYGSCPLCTQCHPEIRDEVKRKKEELAGIEGKSWAIWKSIAIRLAG